MDTEPGMMPAWLWRTTIMAGEDGCTISIIACGTITATTATTTWSITRRQTVATMCGGTTW